MDETDIEKITSAKFNKDLVVGKPWGFEYSVFQQDTSVRVLHIRPGEETSLHCHLNKDVILIVLSGIVLVDVNDERFTLVTFESKSIPKKVFHKTFNAIDDEEAVVLEIESKSDIHDLLRGTDKYNRSQGYEVKEIKSVDDVLK